MIVDEKEAAAVADMMVEKFIFTWGPRVLRGITYAVVSQLLLSMNDYGIERQRYIAAILGVLSVGSKGSDLARVVIFLLFILDIMSPAVLGQIKSALGF